VLRSTLTHPGVLAGLARSGHGDRVLLSDGNFPLALGANPAADVVHLNLRPGLVTVTDVLEAVLTAVAVEAALGMSAPDGSPVPAHDDYRDLLGEEAPLELAERFAFYDACRAREVGLVVVTGDTRLCANLLLTVGLPPREPASRP
jgi:L-fucose mutarotase